MRIRNSRWRIVSSAAYGTTMVVQVVGCETTNRAERASFVLPFEPCARIDAAHPRVVSGRRWRDVARTALAEATPAWSSLRAAAGADFDILPYQLEPALAMVRGDASRFLIADAVGLGKTVQAGLMIAETAARQVDARAIVVCPAGLRDQWCDELNRRFALDARIVDAPSMVRTARELPASVNPWSMHGVAITSIDYVKRPEVIRSLEGLLWDIVVFDEAHNLATHSDRATAAALIAERARHLALLTATPHAGEDDSFARMCSLGELSTHDRLLVFRRSRRDIGVDGRSRNRLLSVKPTTAERIMHEAVRRYASRMWQGAGSSSEARLAASVLMRRACSSAASLARSAERRLALLSIAEDEVEAQRRLPFDPSAPADGEPDWQLASPGLPDGAEERRQLEIILRLAQAAAAHESKVAVLRRLLSRISEPAIVFTEYRDTLMRLAAASGISGQLQLHGALTRRERADVLTQFTHGRSPLLLATDAGSEGLNLHHRCRLVINLELPWTPRRLEQRAGRVDRIGQSRRVHVLGLVAKGTCEEEVLARLTTRVLRAERTMDLLSRGVSEERVAAMVLGDAPQPAGGETAVVLPPAVGAASTAGAGDEAARIITSRELTRRSRRPAIESGSVLARIRRRRRSTPGERVWLFSVACGSPDEQIVWQAVLALHARRGGGAAGTATDTRVLLDPAYVDLAGPLEHHIQRMTEALSRALAEPARRWIARERAIAARLHERHARLSAPLLQPGLFDKRVERLAREHHEALQHVLTRSSARITHLSGLSDVRADPPALVFGVLLE